MQVQLGNNGREATCNNMSYENMFCMRRGIMERHARVTCGFSSPGNHLQNSIYLTCVLHMQGDDGEARQGHVRLVLQGKDGREATFSREIVPPGQT